MTTVLHRHKVLTTDMCAEVQGTTLQKNTYKKLPQRQNQAFVQKYSEVPCRQNQTFVQKYKEVCRGHLCRSTKKYLANKIRHLCRNKRKYFLPALPTYWV
ncbi:hypothetical protein BsWGS_18277 [Bradybaena similaris]